MSGAFASSAFANSAFDVGSVGGGGMPDWLRAALLRGKRKPRPVVQEPDDEEQPEPVAARVALRLRPNATVAGNARLLLAARARELEARDRAEFAAIVGAFIESEEWADA